MTVPRGSGETYQLSYDLALLVPQYHFYYIQLVMQVPKASSDPMGEELEITFQWEE